MCWNGFNDFVEDVGYFEEKIDCHDRHIYLYDEEQTRKDVAQYVEVVEIVNNADTLVMGVLLKEFSKKSLLRYDKEHTRVTIDGWRINDWDHSLRVAIEKYL